MILRVKRSVICAVVDGSVRIGARRSVASVLLAISVFLVPVCALVVRRDRVLMLKAEARSVLCVVRGTSNLLKAKQLANRVLKESTVMSMVQRNARSVRKELVKISPPKCLMRLVSPVRLVLTARTMVLMNALPVPVVTTAMKKE